MLFRVRSFLLASSLLLRWPVLARKDAALSIEVAGIFDRVPAWGIRDFGSWPGVLMAATATPGDRHGPTTSAAADLSIEELYSAHAGSMYRVAVAVVRDHALAEDVVQDAIIKAWRNLHTLREAAAVRGWLLRITHNTAVSTLRMLRDTPVDPVHFPEGGDEHVEGDILDDAFLAAFEEALFGLDEVSRTAVALRELEHMSYDEIADVLGVRLPTVKTRLFRARAHLVEALGDWKPQ